MPILPLDHPNRSAPDLRLELYPEQGQVIGHTVREAITEASPPTP